MHNKIFIVLNPLKGNILDCLFFNEVVDMFKEIASHRYSSGHVVLIIQLAKILYWDGIIL